jgi:universal stress protein A
MNKLVETQSTSLLANHPAPKRPAQSMSPQSATPATSAIQLKKILAPIDFSETSPQVVAYAVRFVEQFGAQLVLLHVVQPPLDLAPPEAFSLRPPSEMYAEVTQEAQAKLTRWKEDIAMGAMDTTGDLFITTVIRGGEPDREIVNVARELEIDLIVIATHGYTGLKHVLLGSTAERVVRHAPCPVFVVREQEHDSLLQAQESVSD